MVAQKTPTGVREWTEAEKDGMKQQHMFTIKLSFTQTTFSFLAQEVQQCGGGVGGKYIL